jgi:hypothetical protein
MIKHAATIGILVALVGCQRGPENESAEWFGKTGLSEDIERELPRYLRREFGESLSEPTSLKAADLTYIGSFQEEGHLVHYWRIPYGKEEVYAYVEVSPESTHTGWGGRKPKVLEAK